MTATNDLLTKKCVPCEGTEDPLSNQREHELHSAVPEWTLEREGIHSIKRTFEFKNFSQALTFLNQVGDLAEDEGHHPDLYLHDYKFLTITLYTHAIRGLSENDFIMAAKINELY